MPRGSVSLVNLQVRDQVPSAGVLVKIWGKLPLQQIVKAAAGDPLRRETCHWNCRCVHMRRIHGHIERLDRRCGTLLHRGRLWANSPCSKRKHRTRRTVEVAAPPVGLAHENT
jgi:hypothetical protein